MQLIKQYEKKNPEAVFEWRDNETDAVGWLVIDSLRGGASGGGTRMRKGLDKDEVVSLAKVMGVKFSAIGFPIGGAKSGINFDPNDHRKSDVLKRWYKAIKPMLKNYYGTGGDLNVDEVDDVIPLTKKLGILHPQEGILRGHLDLDKKEQKKRITQLQKGVSKTISHPKYSPDNEGKYCVADMITGYGVAESIKHYYDIYGGNISGKKVIIQGWGNVGAAAGYYLSQYGAKIVAIVDKLGGVIKREGFTCDEVKNLFINNKYSNICKADNFISADLLNTQVWDIDVDVFIPAAASKIVTKQIVDRMIKGGLRLISSGANAPFDDKESLFGPVCQYVDKSVSLIPDFVSNSGMARTFAYLMCSDVVLNDDAIFLDTSNTIKCLIKKAYDKTHSDVGVTKTLLDMFIS